jgi:hypothetical protein
VAEVADGVPGVEGLPGEQNPQAVGDVVAGGVGAAEVLGEDGPVRIGGHIDPGEGGAEFGPTLGWFGGRLDRSGRWLGQPLGEAPPGATAGVVGPGVPGVEDFVDRGRGSDTVLFGDGVRAFEPAGGGQRPDDIGRAASGVDAAFDGVKPVRVNGGAVGNDLLGERRCGGETAA